MYGGSYGFALGLQPQIGQSNVNWSGNIGAPRVATSANGRVFVQDAFGRTHEVKYQPHVHQIKTQPIVIQKKKKCIRMETEFTGYDQQTAQKWTVKYYNDGSSKRILVATVSKQILISVNSHNQRATKSVWIWSDGTKTEKYF